MSDAADTLGTMDPLVALLLGIVIGVVIGGLVALLLLRRRGAAVANPALAITPRGVPERNCTP